MLLETAASIGFRTARAIYTAGSKSANKLHLGEHSEFIASRHNYSIVKFGGEQAEIDQYYGNRLDLAAKKLTILRSRIKGDFFEMGTKLINLAGGVGLAANCGELACMAAASAYYNLGRPDPAPVALINLQAPADHVFCAVGPRMLLERLSGGTIEGLSASWASNYIWAADPWLNILSKLKDYPARAKAKLNKWHLANKRIAWNEGPQGPGWYAALGDYSKGFAAAKLDVILG